MPVLDRKQVPFRYGLFTFPCRGSHTRLSLLLCIDMGEFANKFYSSQAWKDCRNGYLKSVGGLCERCLKRGIYKPAEIIHHKIFLTPSNIENPLITLDWGNLTALCRDCHADMHGTRRRYAVNPDGSIAPRAD